MITNEQRDNLLLQYYDRGILKKEIRSYEVSLWTLQDEFITVLKWSDVEQQGRIENAKMTLNIDGTQQLSFSIPMYYWMNGELKENPNWYNTQNGNLIKGLRKLKVIFNKGDYPIEEASKHVFEFVIIDIAESHDTDILTCEIKAEGLAFQELGKIGYKLNLSQANFELDYQDWEETGHWTKKDGTTSTQQPIQSVNYWCEECCDLLPIPDNGPISSHIWYYDIQMNWKSFEGAENRSSKKVYEETYTTSWADNLTPNGVQSYQEKARAVEIDNSNLYNITQTIAEKFGIFCRYEYLYDANYHIVGKKIVFYNNFMNEDPTQTISLQYPYSSSKITRTQASAEVTTKLFVLDVDNDATAGGLNSITFSPSNYSHEDYILNFDYMYETGAINKEQYEYIATYNQQMRTINSVLENLQLQRDTYEFQKPEIEAKQTIARNSIALDQEQELQNSALRNELDSKDGQDDGFITITNANADYLLISKGENDTYYINLARTNKGIVEDSVKIYRHLSNGTLSGEITNFSFNYDQYGNLSSISLKAISEITENDKVLTRAFLTYKYDPCLYYDKVVKIWQTKLAKDQQDLDNYTAELAVINQKLDSIYEQIEAKIAEKEKAVKAFERMMGPAIREGYWQPENYNDYGDRYIINKPISNNDITADSGNDAIVAWDKEVFDTEETLYYEIGINQDLEYYPCVDLNAVFPNGIPSNLDEYSVVWKATNINGYSYDWDSIKDLTIFHVNSQALIRFIKYNNTVKPVLMLVGAKNLSAEQITRMKSAGAGARLEIYSTTVENGTISVSHGSTQYSIGNNWIQVAAGTNKTTTPIIYPRIKFSSLLLKTDTSNLYIKYNNQLLELGKDYYIRTRNTLRTSDQNYYPEYYITIKPETIIKYGVGHEVNVDYILSNANTSIYLDALQVSKENAYPKAAYELDTSILNVDLTNRLYDTLAQIVMINDAQLKLHNAFGYISQVELDLDHYENDKIEIKNYKTKFEDLFSTIIAQTEAMKQMGTGIGAAVNGSIPLSAAATESTLAQQTNIFQAYLDSYFDSSEVVKQRLKELFNEAGKILGDANKSLKSVQALTVENAAILSGFAQNIQEELTAKVTKSKEKPASFKVGDIWIQEDDEGNEIGRYVATFNSADLTKDDTESGTGGFVQTFDGTLASITGTNMDIDTNNGKIDIYGTHEINLRSGEHVYIGAGDTIDIVGNNAVNIGGGSINIAADSTGTHKGGIHIVSSGINFQQSDTAIDTAIEGAIASTNANISKVLIDPGKIELGSSDILMRGANKIQMVTSRGTSNNTSAIEISPDTGVWIGSGRGIRLFSGGFSYNATTNELTKISASGASVELNNEHLILGFMNTSSTGNAIELDQDKIIIASGSATIGNQNVTGTSNSLIGAKFTKDSIGMAVQAVNGSTTTTTAFLMDVHGFTVGSDGINVAADTLRDTARGSYIRINGEGIELGSLADLYINTDNFKLQTHSRDKNNTNFTEGETIMALGNKLQSIDYYTQIVDGVLKDKNGNTLPTTGDNAPNVRLLVNKNGLYAKGSVYADSFIAVGPSGYLKATASTFGFYDSNNNPILTINNNAEIEANKKLSISAENLYIGNQNYSTIATNINNNNTIESLKMYRLWNSNSNSTNIISGNGTTTVDTNWTENVPTPTSNTPYIWSVMRYKKGDNKYYYSTPQYEETLSNLKETTYYKFKRTNSAIAPTISNLNDLNTNWSLEVPTATVSGNASTAASLDKPYIWRTTVTVKVGDRISWTTPERAEDYEGFSNVGLTAINIANGYTSVPYVDSTGIKIQNGNITISAQAGIQLQSNSSLSFTTSSGNNALIFDNDGITLASAKSIALAANGTLDIVTSNVTIKSEAANGQNYFYVGDSGSSPTSYIKYGKDDQGNSIFKVKGDIEATNLTITGQSISDMISANLASIGGWTIDSTRIYSRYNDSDTNYVALDSGTANENYAIWAGDDQSSDAPFRVKRNGDVYLNALMVLDQRTRASADVAWGNWEIDNNATHETPYVTDTDTLQEAYVPINFSQLNFKQAVSVRGDWSGNTLTVTATLWGKISKTTTTSASFYISSVEAGAIQGSETQLVTINYTETYGTNETPYSSSYPITCHGIWQNGYDSGYLNASIKGTGTFVAWSGSSVMSITVDDNEGTSHTVTIPDIPAQSLDISWGEAGWFAGGCVARVTVNGTTYTHTYNEAE